MVIHRRSRILPLLLAAGLGAPLARAEDGFPSVKFSGFATIVAGKIVNNPPPGLSPDPSYPGPMYIADWGNWSIYDKSLAAKPESRAGVQAVVAFSDSLRFTGQTVLRGVDTSLDLTWAFLSYDLAPGLELQVGRKRIPIYYYSDFQDIGYSYPWVSPPPEVYGWEATNYNGASLRYKTTVGGAPVSTSLFAGKETVKEARYMRSSGQSKTDVSWSNLVGGDLETNLSWLTLRGVYLQADALFTDRLDAGNNASQKLKAYGLAANADFEHWFVLSEIGAFSRTYDAYYLNQPSLSVGVGYRLDKWTPFLNYAQYRESTSDPDWAPQNYRRTSLTIRYDLTSNSAIKVQLDKYSEFNGTHYVGDSTALRASFNVVF